MLIAVNMGLDARVESMAVLDEPVRTALEQTVYTYEGDSAFSARMDGMGVSDPVAGELIAANREVRANARRHRDVDRRRARGARPVHHVSQKIQGRGGG
ncbi:MAG: hypothetical protein ACLTSX_10845 [Collinsella sp.]